MPAAHSETISGQKIQYGILVTRCQPADLSDALRKNPTQTSQQRYHCQIVLVQGTPNGMCVLTINSTYNVSCKDGIARRSSDEMSLSQSIKLVAANVQSHC